MKILVADDNRLIVEDVIDELSKIVPEAECTGTTDPTGILLLCAQNRYDVICMDIDMPGTNGIVLAKRILDKYPRTNIIYITGYIEYAAESYETFASAFLTKPVSTERLRRAMENLRFPVSVITDEMTDENYSVNTVIGNRIRKYRERRAMWRDEFSEMMDVSIQTVYRWENGERIPPVQTLMKIAHILGISTDDLLKDDQDQRGG